jgi:superfamily II DNA or RNA helicase
MQPRDYQLPSIERLTKALPRFGACLDASDTGVGKTYVAAFTAKALGWKVAVVCPKSVVPSWELALKKIGVPYLFIENPERIRYQAQWGTTCKEGFGWEWKLPERCLIIFDEAHRFSGAESLQAKMLASAPKPVLMISATCADSPLKMHAIGHQLGIVHWDKWFAWCFKNGCVFNKPFRGLKYIGDDSVLKRIHNQIFAEKGVRIRIADLGDAFPDNSVEAVPIPLEDVWEVNAEYIKAIELLEEEAPNAAVAMLRARQLSEHRKLRAMIDMTDDLLENGKSVAIFVCFRESLDQLEKQFPEASLIYGGQPTDERADAINDFQSNQTRIIIAMIQAGGVGINLHDLDGNFPRVSLINPSFSAIELIQTLGRIHRNGGKSPCIQKILFAAETVEERVREKVEAKASRIQLINDHDLML